LVYIRLTTNGLIPLTISSPDFLLLECPDDVDDDELAVVVELPLVDKDKFCMMEVVYGLVRDGSSHKE